LWPFSEDLGFCGKEKKTVLQLQKAFSLSLSDQSAGSFRKALGLGHIGPSMGAVRIGG
jgi:hypothetical protein